MKKILLLLSVAVMTMTSCTPENSLPEGVDENLIADPTVVLPKKISSGDEESSIVYNGRKMVKITTKAGSTIYTYEGDLIVKILSMEEEDGKKVNDLVLYTYEDGKLKTEWTNITSIDEATNKTTIIRNTKIYYTHKSDGTMEAKDYNVDPNGSETLAYSRVLTFLNGNVVNEVGQSAKTDGHFTKDYEYDTNNNAFINVVGFDKIRFSINNVSKITHSFRTEVGTEGQNVTEYGYTYTENGYPLTLIKKLNSDIVDEKSFTY